MRSLAVLLCTALTACAGTSVRPSGEAAGGPVPTRGPIDSALYRAALQVAVTPSAKGGAVTVATRQLAGDSLSPSVTFDLGKASAPDVSAREAVLRSLGMAASDDVGWGRCPASTSRSADRGGCPQGPTRRLAVGAPARYPRDVPLGRLQSAPCQADGAPQCWIVRLLETSLAPGGAQSRTEFLYFQQRDGKWVLADRKQGTTLE